MSRSVHWKCERCRRREEQNEARTPLGWAVLKLLCAADSRGVVNVSLSREWDLCRACSEDLKVWATTRPAPPTKRKKRGE